MKEDLNKSPNTKGGSDGQNLRRLIWIAMRVFKNCLAQQNVNIND